MVNIDIAEVYDGSGVMLPLNVVSFVFVCWRGGHKFCPSPPSSIYGSENEK